MVASNFALCRAAALASAAAGLGFVGGEFLLLIVAQQGQDVRMFLVADFVHLLVGVLLNTDDLGLLIVGEIGQLAVGLVDLGRTAGGSSGRGGSGGCWCVRGDKH